MAKEMKSFNGYEIVDKTARDRIDELNLKIPGRNLILGSRTFTGRNWIEGNNVSYSNSIVDGFTVAYKNYAWNPTKPEFYVNAGEVLTFSGYVKCVNTAYEMIYHCGYYINNADCDYLQPSTYIETTSDGFEYRYFTIKVRKSGYIRPGFEALNNNGTIYMYGYKLEYGDTPTPWSPAPEDNMPSLLSGSSTPNNNYGSNGDFYIMY